MSLYYEAQNEDPDEVVTLWPDQSNVIVVPDSALLFGGDFFRVGPDLYIVNDATANFRVPEYFSQNKPADLHDPNGAVLRGDLVDVMAGPVAPGQYAQVGDVARVEPIGQVETAEGVTSVQRVDGTVETLQVGAKVYQKDVIATGEDASVSVTFLDGTIFTLAASSRMVIDELIYDPEAADNSGGFSLIQGSFVFIAGQVAKTGGMDVNTPSSTMGIRGTTVLVQVGTVDGVDTTEITLTKDPDGTTGQVELRDIDGNLVAFITQTDTKWIVSAATGETREVDRTLQDEADDNLLIAEAFAAYRSAVSRAEAGDGFVSATNPAPETGDRNAPADPPADLGGDDTDNLDVIQLPPEVNEPDVDDGGTFDEGLITPEDPSQIVTVSGLEDSGEEDAITGDLGGAANAAGTVFTVNSGPSNGNVSVAPDGQFDYVPDPDFNGTDSFTFFATAPNGETTEGTVIVQVLPVNDAPEASDTTETVDENAIVTGTIAASDVDGDVLSYAISVSPTNGELSLFQDGTFSYQPNADFTGTDSFRVTVTDPSGEAAEALVTVTVSALNDAPVITTITGANLGTVVEGDEQADAEGQLEARASDPGNTVTWSGSSTAMFGTFAITASGAWTYALMNDLADSIAEGETVVETFTAVATDPFGASVAQTVEVTLTGTNDAPTVAENTVFEIGQNAVLTNQLTATDVDSSGDLTFAPGSEGPANGSLDLNTDGSFTYTPDAGFAGVDRFSYTVTDGDGGMTTGRVTTAVESGANTAHNQSVTLGLTVEADADTVAGAITVDVPSVQAQSVNLIIAIDSSDGISEADWATQLEAVRDAVAQLADQFSGSGAAVNVQIISHSAQSFAIGPFDLQDPTLAAEILSMPYRPGATAWDAAFDEAADFLSGQPAGASNVMLFVAQSMPSNQAWRDALEALVNPPDGTFSVDVQTIGIGVGVDPSLLQEIDSDPILLSTAEGLATALTQSQVFTPSLIGLDVSLNVDGVDVGTIATQDGGGLTFDGTTYDMPLASIENIAMLLGESNRINVTARFDTDGDENTAEIELFASDVIGKADTAQMTAGFAEADLLFGSDLADQIEGGGGNDVILGYDGADTLDGGTGADTVLAGDGDDVLRVSEAPTSGLDVLDGGAGRDVLHIDVGGNLTDDLIPSLSLRDIEAIDMDNGQANTLQITLADVVDLSTTSDSQLEALLDAALPQSAVIYGDVADSLTLLGDGSGGFEKVSNTPVDDGNGNTLDIYAYVEGGNVLATLGVDSDIDVTTTVPVG